MSEPKYTRQTTKECKGLKYESKKYPYIYGKQGCVYTSGCGLCASKTIVEGMLNYTTNTKAWRNYMLKIGARDTNGTNMSIVAKNLKKDFGINCTVTNNVDELVQHLRKGLKAVVNAGAANIFSSDGHWISAVGITPKGKIICYDSYWYEGKFNTNYRKKYIKVSGRKCYISPKDLDKDAQGNKYWLFTPTKNIKHKYCTDDYMLHKTIKKTVKANGGLKGYKNIKTPSYTLIPEGTTVIVKKDNAGTKKIKNHTYVMSLIKYKDTNYYVAREYLK